LPPELLGQPSAPPGGRADCMLVAAEQGESPGDAPPELGVENLVPEAGIGIDHPQPVRRIGGCEAIERDLELGGAPDDEGEAEPGFAVTLTPVPSPTRTPATRERGATTQRIEKQGALSPLSRAGVSAGGRGG